MIEGLDEIISQSKKKEDEKKVINIAEFDQGIFGIEEASQQLFGLPASQLSLSEASLLAAVLPNPKQRSVKNPSLFVQRRALAISDGASTILKDERSQCFTD